MAESRPASQPLPPSPKEDEMVTIKSPVASQPSVLPRVVAPYVSQAVNRETPIGELTPSLEDVYHIKHVSTQDATDKAAIVPGQYGDSSTMLSSIVGKTTGQAIDHSLGIRNNRTTTASEFLKVMKGKNRPQQPTPLPISDELDKAA